MGSEGRYIILVGLILLSLGAIPFAHAEDAPSSITLDSVTTDHQNATADGTYANGWKWEFHFTVPTGETQFKMKFSNFIHGSDSVPASNIRFFSEQFSAHTSEATAVSIAGADTWSDEVDLTSDTSPEVAGNQITVVVEVAIPSGTPGGTYSGDYDVESDVPPDTEPPVITLIGNAIVGLFIGGTYTEQGATAADNVDPVVNVTIGGDTVTTTAPATFHITYDAEDLAHNHALQVVRTVTVIPFILPPLCPPVCEN